MDNIPLIILLLAVLVGLSAVAPRLRVPYPVLLVVGGGLLALVPGLPPFHLEPDLIFLILRLLVRQLSTMNTSIHRPAW